MSTAGTVDFPREEWQSPEAALAPGLHLFDGKYGVVFLLHRRTEDVLGNLCA